MAPRPSPRPPWLKVRLPSGEDFFALKEMTRRLGLHTVCEEALCPNIADCWKRSAATFMILGDVCTRACRFCAVKTGRPEPHDADEPLRVAHAVDEMRLAYAVITSVDRDDLPDGGASAFAATVAAIRSRRPTCRVELLVPDFKHSLESSLRCLVRARPDVLGHNVETVRRLYPNARPGADLDGSLELLSRAKQLAPDLTTKSGFMLGLGETVEEVRELLEHLRNRCVDIVTIGQYLRPTRQCLPVAEYVHPERFAELKEFGEFIGISHVESGPLVRSSYLAEQQIATLGADL